MSTYLPNIPTGLVNLDEDYLNIQNNFTQLNTSFGINHLPYNDQTNKNGKHTFVEMVDNTVIPAGLKPSEGTLYTKSNAGVTDMYYTPDNSGNEYQITRVGTANFGTFGAVTGWTFLPGGLLFQWGLATSVGTSLPNTTIIFPKPYTNPAYSVNCSIITTQNTRQSVNIFDVSNTQFRAAAKDAGGSITSGLTFYWQAVGK